MKIFFDCGFRGDPAAMEIAVVPAGRTTILPGLGHGTSTDADWLAPIHAMTIAQLLGLSDFVLLGDPADVIAKANGSARWRGGGAGHLERFRALTFSERPPRVRYVKRDDKRLHAAAREVHKVAPRRTDSDVCAGRHATMYRRHR
mgnify:CR=1 FL=1